MATGVSVNLGVLGLAIEAVNLGYQVVVPRDAVAGLPQDYADAVLDNTFPLISTLTTGRRPARGGRRVRFGLGERLQSVRVPSSWIMALVGSSSTVMSGTGKLKSWYLRWAVWR